MKYKDNKNKIYPSYYKKFKNYDFGNYGLKSIGLYKMEKKKTDLDHFYIEESSISFPKIIDIEEIKPYETNDEKIDDNNPLIPLDPDIDLPESIDDLNKDIPSSIIFDGNNFVNGGGQLLRTALSLSCLYKIPFIFNNIRAFRKPKTGLLAQHLAGVITMSDFFDADVIGDCLGSTSLDFTPSEFQNIKDYSINISTAGSISLIIQTILPSLIISKEQMNIKIFGGTHVLASPFIESLEYGLKPYLNMMGINYDIKLKRYGFFPRGIINNVFNYFYKIIIHL